MKSILVTGSAGFIGSNLVLRLLDSKEPVKIVGLDNMNDYYDPSLKEYRLKLIEGKYRSVIPSEAKGSPCEYTFVRGSIADRELVNRLFEDNKFDIVVNLAAQAGVRYSIENPVGEIKPRSMLVLDDDITIALEKMKHLNEFRAKLPQKDCGVCGAPTCDALAHDIVMGEAKLSDCIFMRQE